MAREEKPLKKRKSKNGTQGVYLLFVDDSEEFPLALEYGLALAQSNNAHIGLLHVVEDEEFQQWGTIQDKMRREMRENAENLVWSYAKRVDEACGMKSSLFIEQGNKFDAVVRIIDEDPNIKMLILAANDASNPGPLVAHFTAKGLARLRVPLVVVPGHLSEKDIEAVS